MSVDISYDDAEYFKTVYGRTLNRLNPRYMLPADEDEVKVQLFLPQLDGPTAFYSINEISQRSELHHRLLQFVFRGKNYLGPVKEALQFGEQRRGRHIFHPLPFAALTLLLVLDLGTGGGFWYVD